MMIFGEENDRGRGRELTGKVISRPLHNFKMPCLKWSNQRLLRCMKVEPDGHVSSLCATDRRFSLAPEKGSFKRRSNRPESFRGVDLIEAIEALPSPGSQAEYQGGHGIKIIFDFQKAVDKLDVGMADEGSEKQQAAPPSSTVAVRPWNMTKRRAEFKGGDVVEGVKAVGEKKPNSLPLRAENRCQEVLADGRKEREKFSVVLSRKEIEEDFMALTGKKPPRRPKKWPKNIQKDVDNLFPGLWLTEVTADMYKIPEAPERQK